MGLLSTEVEVGLFASNIKRYESLGYKIPRYINKYGNLVAKQDEKLLVRIEDLSVGSNVKVDVDCDNCKKKYRITYYDYNKSLHDGKNYCVDCASKILNSGENHYLWDFQKTEEERISGRRTIDGYSDFIKGVLMRDEYTCQCCKNKDVVLNAHHLNSYDWFVEGRTDVKNGITLCEKCHKNFHSLYGKGNNTKEQFEEWSGSVCLMKDFDGELNTARKVYCIDNDTVYSNIFEFCEVNKIKGCAYAYMVCNHEHYDSNGASFVPKSIHGLHILWYDKYINMTKDEIDTYLIHNKGNPRKMVICLSDQKIFNSISEAARFYKVGRNSIMDCCNNVKSSHKRNDGVLLTWQYYNNINKKIKEIC